MCLGFDSLLLVVIINNNTYNINFILGSDAEGNHTVYGVSGISLIHSSDIWLKQYLLTGKKKKVERTQSDLNTLNLALLLLQLPLLMHIVCC